MRPEPGRCYADGNGDVHGPLREHPANPETWLIAVGATYWRDTGRHVSGDLSPAHEALNLVREVIVTDASEAPPVPERTTTNTREPGEFGDGVTVYAEIPDLEFENGLLTKVGGTRPERMSGYDLVHLVRSLAARIRDLERDRSFFADFVRSRIPEIADGGQAELPLAWVGLVVTLENRVAELEQIRERWRRSSIETHEAMTAMRNAINEHVPMPSIESDLLSGPENSVFFAAVAEAVVTALRTLPEAPRTLDYASTGTEGDHQ